MTGNGIFDPIARDTFWEGAQPCAEPSRKLDTHPWRLWMTDADNRFRRSTIDSFHQQRDIVEVRFRASRPGPNPPAELGWLIAFPTQDDAALFRLILS